MSYSQSYGGNKYGQYNYGGIPNVYEPGIHVLIEIYTNAWIYKGAYQSGHCDLISTRFSHDESGCRDFTIIFGSLKNINKNDIIKIKLFNSDDYFFTGVVRIIPIVGSTKIKYEYSGQGLASYLIRMNTGSSLSYASKTVLYIANDITSSIVATKSPIKYDASRIANDLINTTITTATFKYVQINDTFDALKKIANSDGNDYLIGVDKDGYFFFRPRSTIVNATLSIGTRGDYCIPNYEPSDEYEARTKYYVLKKDGTYFTTVTTSQVGNDIYEEKITAPDIDNASITNWANGILKDNEVNKRSATIDWKIKNYYPQPLVADGKIRIISAIPPKNQLVVTAQNWGDGNWGDNLWGGNDPLWTIVDDTLNVIEVAYQIDNKNKNRQITLGTILPRLEKEIVDIRKKLIDTQISLGV